MIRTACPFCGTTQSGPGNDGWTATCQQCGKSFVVPRPAALNDTIPGSAVAQSAGPRYRGPGLTRGGPRVQFACPRCRTAYEVAPRVIGKRFACRTCGQRLRVPSATPPPPVVPAPQRHHPLVQRLLGVVAALLLIGSTMLLAASLHHRPTGAKEQPPPALPVDPSTTLGQQAFDILKINCARCHGDGSPGEGGFNYILDRDKLIARKKIVPGDAEQSKIYRRVSRGEMPPPDEGGPLSADAVALLKHWIDAGAPAATAPADRSGFVEDKAVVVLMRDDLLTVPERERRFARYFTLTNLANAGASADDLQTARAALSKLLNSLSWNRSIVPQHPVGPTGTVLRIDLRDYSWNANTWQRILSIYPHGVRSDLPAARELFDAAGGQLPYIRADWFVANAARPPLYYDLLGLPDNESALEQLLHINVADDIRQDRVARSGFNGSGIARNNRLIERHDLPYGSYWRSYDFADPHGPHNIFARPLGPGQGAGNFNPDGGEIIFNLPNGLHAYELVNAQGRRLDKAPQTIVSDPRRPDRAVENGVSCMSCHAAGLIPKDDQVLADVQRNANAFPQDEADTIAALYPPPATLKGLFEKDNQRYQKSLEKTGTRLGAPEPITAVVAQYEKDLDLSAAAAELGLRPKTLSARLNESAVLARTLGPLKVEGGSVQRQVFNEAFPDVVRELRLGTYLPPH